VGKRQKPVVVDLVVVAKKKQRPANLGRSLLYGKKGGREEKSRVAPRGGVTNGKTGRRQLRATSEQAKVGMSLPSLVTVKKNQVFSGGGGKGYKGRMSPWGEGQVTGKKWTVSVGQKDERNLGHAHICSENSRRERGIQIQKLPLCMERAKRNPDSPSLT